ncbi:hypothetical protein ABWE90_01095 [Pasteurella multocida]|uniref:hypothetical protein n=1 Tax=Pasteurella TaxID=745 RepID=UPI000310AF97|nr:hypothetical protein [Pasteurella multocida]MDY0577895.1 hypothetical protein [Pasteurella multocida]MEB3472728.1 hypothetical protein [Pasteurella multocida]MEB3486762.1 hypothetical protein [Pasteurella multocida]MEB3497451.1 hypothetical protein [Pasteurella multocida]MEB3501985.1 hypothetical protein [Pasteurella multocida]
MRNYSKTKLKIHLKEGLEMEANTSPVMRVAIAFAIAVIALGIALAFSTPFINAIRWW